MKSQLQPPLEEQLSHRWVGRAARALDDFEVTGALVFGFESWGF